MAVAAAPPPEAIIARVIAPVRATSRPAGERVLAAVAPLAPLSHGPTQLRVLARRTVAGRSWVKVLLPRRPNGSAGWIPADRVQLRRTAYAVEIDRAARRLVVRRRGRVVRSVSIVVGAAGSPTPAGAFAISEELKGDPRAFTGAWVLPLTAYSGTYREFDGGPGRVAIHGRGGASLRDPLGSAASHGCIRVSNRVVRWMASHLQPGVPVRIR
jgi:lipoprotein-anchoring transpeptidase ErfK/SrfK